MHVSVVVVANRRMNTLYGILEEWKRQSPDVWLADCSGSSFVAPAGVNHVRFSPDPGNRTRHAVALLTSGGFVIKADDDFVPGPKLVEDFLRAGINRGPCFFGIMGRRFEGPRYYGNTISARANKITIPERVDFVGICTMSPRSASPLIFADAPLRSKSCSNSAVLSLTFRNMLSPRLIIRISPEPTDRAASARMRKLKKNGRHIILKFGKTVVRYGWEKQHERRTIAFLPPGPATCVDASKKQEASNPAPALHRTPSGREVL